MPDIEYWWGGGRGRPGRPAEWGGGVGTAIHINYDTGPLHSMNNDAKYCFTSTLDTMPDDNDIISPYTQYNVNSPFFDKQSLTAKHSHHKQPLFFSLNSQSLQSKHANISLLLSELASKHVNVDILALQETWRIPYTEIVEIPGYIFTHKHCTANRGEGWAST